MRYREATLIGADGVVSWAKKRPCRSDHPVCAASVASQHCYWRSHPSSARRGIFLANQNLDVALQIVFNDAVKCGDSVLPGDFLSLAVIPAEVGDRDFVHAA